MMAGMGRVLVMKIKNQSFDSKSKLAQRKLFADDPFILWPKMILPTE
jgi:hypothetical protein